MAPIAQCRAPPRRAVCSQVDHRNCLCKLEIAAVAFVVADADAGQSITAIRRFRLSWPAIGNMASRYQVDAILYQDEKAHINSDDEAPINYGQLLALAVYLFIHLLMM